MIRTATLPRFRAVSRALSSPDDLLSFTDPERPLVWLRADHGMVGVGESLRLTFRGPDRIAEAAAAWRALVDASDVDDEVRLPGTGLVSLGAFAFSDDSQDESVLIVPRTVIGRDGEDYWITRIAVRGEDVQGDGKPHGRDSDTDTDANATPISRPLGPWRGTVLQAQPGAVDAYLAGVEEAVRRIDDHRLEKVVLARQIAGSIAPSDDLRLPVSRLAERYGDCWTFAVDGLIGASPETLVSSHSGAVSARVLAGTRGRRTDDPERDERTRDELLASPKEQQEHGFAVRSVLQALEPHVDQLRADPSPFALRLPNVWHLATDVEATTGAGGSVLDLVGALHPTAAVAGTPTDVATATIAEFEPFDRGRYSGAVGWIDADGDGEWAIALRSAQVRDVPVHDVPVNDVPVRDAENGRREVTASAGGGIVSGSDAAHELRETVSKLRPITEAFGA